MPKKIAVFVISLCLASVSPPSNAQIIPDLSGNCDRTCEREKTFKAFGIAILVVIGVAYLKKNDDGAQSEIAKQNNNMDGNRFQLVPHLNTFNNYGFDLEYRLNDEAKIGSRTRYGEDDVERPNRRENSYFGGFFYQLRF